MGLNGRVARRYLKGFLKGGPGGAHAMRPHLGQGPPWPWLVILPQPRQREQGGAASFQMHIIPLMDRDD